MTVFKESLKLVILKMFRTVYLISDGNSALFVHRQVSKGIRDFRAIAVITFLG